MGRGSRRRRRTQWGRGSSGDYKLLVQNDGNLSDGITVTGGGGCPGFVVQYFSGQVDVTAQVVAGLTFSSIPRTDELLLVARVTVTKDAKPHALCGTRIQLTSTSRSQVSDAIELNTQAR